MPMRLSVLRRPARALASVALVGCSLAGFGATPATAVFRVAALAAAAGDNAGNAAILRLGSCLAAGGKGDVLILIDTSSSMKQTDPGAGRVAAAKYLVKQLAKFVGSTPDSSIDVALGGFAGDFSLTSKWTNLTGSSVSGVQGQIDAFKTRQTGFETDYWQAMNGARKALAAKVGSSERTCQAVVWLTDGKYDLDYRHNATERSKYGETKPYGPEVKLDNDAHANQVQAAGRQDLCRVGGVADQLRAQGVVTLAIGLGTDPAAFGLMKGVASGNGDGKACGKDTDPVPGAFVTGAGVDGLLLAFDSLSDPTHPPTTKTFSICPTADKCVNGTQTFALDSTIDKVRLLASTDSTAYKVYLDSPSGKQVVLDPATSGTARLPGASVTTESESKNTVQIELTRTNDAAWTGAWHVAFVDPTSHGAVTTNLRLYGDVKPVVVDAASLTLQAGESADIMLGLTHADGSVIDASTVTSKVILNGRLVAVSGEPIPFASKLTAADLAKPVSLDLAGVSVGKAKIVVDLQLTTTAPPGGKGTALEPEQAEFPVTIAAPPDFPTLPARVTFAATDQVGDHSTTLPISGKGCAWLASDTNETRPEGVGSIDVSSSAGAEKACVSGALPLTLTSDTVGPGLASGTLTVLTKATSSDKVVPVKVRYEIEMQRPRNNAVFWPVLVGFTLAGILIPVGLLYLVKMLTSRIPGSAVGIGSVSGPVGTDSSFLPGVSLSEQEFRSEILEGTDRRSLRLNDQSVIRARTGLGLTEPGYCVVDGQFSVSSTTPGSTRKGEARLPLAIRDRWIALLDGSDPQNGPVQVVFLLAPGSGRLGELLNDARSRVPDLVRRLRDQLRESGNGDGTDAGVLAGASAGSVSGGGWGSSSGSATPAAPGAGGTSWGSPPTPPSGPPTPPPSGDGWGSGGWSS